MAGLNKKLLECIEMAETGWKWLDMAGKAGNGLKLHEMAGNG